MYVVIYYYFDDDLLHQMAAQIFKKNIHKITTEYMLT